jgi:hypothetical protein
LVIEEEVVLYDFEGKALLPLDQSVNALEGFLNELMKSDILRIINLRDSRQHMKFGDETVPQSR